MQLKFEGVTETLFQKTKVEVDKYLQKINPEVIKKLLAAYNRLNSKNPEEWSQAMSSCRNALKAFADGVFPGQKEKYETKDNRFLDVSDIKVKNRLIAHIDAKTKGNKRKLLIARVAEMEKRIHTLEDLLSQGTHNSLEMRDVAMCVIETYFLMGSLLDLKD